MNLRTDVPNPTLKIAPKANDENCSRYKLLTYKSQYSRMGSYILKDNKENMVHYGMISKEEKPYPKGSFALGTVPQYKSKGQNFDNPPQPKINVSESQSLKRTGHSIEEGAPPVKRCKYQDRFKGVPLSERGTIIIEGSVIKQVSKLKPDHPALCQNSNYFVLKG